MIKTVKAIKRVVKDRDRSLRLVFEVFEVGFKAGL